MQQQFSDKNQEAVIYVGNLDLKVHEELLWELFVQVAPVVNVHMPRDKITQDHQGYGFVEFKAEQDADYAIKIMHMIKLYGKAIKVNKATQDKRQQETGANIYIGNLDTKLTEKDLYDIFIKFGLITSCKIVGGQLANRYGLISYDNFDSSDNAIEAMNGQFIGQKQVKLSYAFKSSSKQKDKHGTEAERFLAQCKQFITPQYNMPAQQFNLIMGNQVPQVPLPPIPLPQKPGQELGKSQQLGDKQENKNGNQVLAEQMNKMQVSQVANESQSAKNQNIQQIFQAPTMSLPPRPGTAQQEVSSNIQFPQIPNQLLSNAQVPKMPLPPRPNDQNNQNSQNF